ncbi:MAG TPA: alpha/beta fold hydrolase [Candidatus Limnocylindrales bacterium]|nr:alpha/beta fold hydrolase [Candidatus Limnocylindrales bacterium]
MGISHWKDAGARSAYEHAYAASRELWPIPCESRFVPTPFGDTHVIVSGEPDGAPVVMLHAASLSAVQWYLQAERLGLTHRLFAVDIMGDIGLSRQRGGIHTRAQAAEWLAGTLDGLELGNVALVGSSFGGFHAVNLAVARPDRVRSLTLLAPAATLKPFKLLANVAIRTGSLLPLPMTVEPGLRGMMGGELPDARIVRQMQIGVRGFRYDRAGIFPSEIPDPELAGVGCPTLVLLGDREMIYDPEEAARRAAALIPDCDVEVVAGVGHLLGMQQPDRVNARVSAFLAAR